MSHSRTGAALLFCLLVPSAACEPPRPAGAFEPDAGGLGEPPPVKLDGWMPMPASDAGTPPDIVVDPPPEPGVDGAVPPPSNPLLADYLFRIDTAVHGPAGSLGNVKTKSSSFGILRVWEEGGALLAHERLCHAQTQQTPDSGSIATRIDPGVPAALEGLTRTLEVDVARGTWSTDAVIRRQGWNSKAASMPTVVAEPLDVFDDPDGNGYPGLAMTVTASIGVGSLVCAYDVVSFATTAYEGGALAADGTLASAAIRVKDDGNHALRATHVSGLGTCDKADVNDATKPITDSDEITLRPVEGGRLADKTACPPLAEFTAALP